MTDREKLIELIWDCACIEGYGTDLMEKQADYLISNGVTVQKWIPVSERLPTAEDANRYGDVVAINKLDGFATTWKWYNIGRHSTIFTYWMPISEPPKECE